MSLRVSFFQVIKPWLLSIAIFGFLALLLAGQFSFSASVPLPKSVLLATAGWLPWALVAPLLFQLVFTLPLERRRWKTALPIHLLVGMLTLLFVIWLGESIAPMPPPPEGPHPHSFHNRPQDPDDFPLPSQGTGTQIFFHLRIRLPIYLAIISLAHALYFYRRGQDRERQSLSLEANLAKSRLETLRLQLQPHFLFNSLNSIAELIHKDPDAADGMLVALSDLLRAALETSGKQELPLYREVAVMEKYLSIEKVRLGDRLETKVHIPSNLRQAMVPTLLLQPIVENAVRHGLEPRSGKGSLVVQATRTGRQLHLNITDDGIGLPEGKVLREGIGLGNTRERLQELYGAEASITVMAGKDAKGVIVDISLPLRETT